MQIDEKLLEFLKITNIQQLIAQNRFDIVYEKLSKKLAFEYISEFTKLLYASGIDPVIYMSKIPSYFLIRTDINEFTIPDWIKSIGDSAFYDCMSLKKITIPDSVTNIEDGAFYGCIDLSSITIPDSVVSIGNFVFETCSSLTNITLPNSIKNIGYCSFCDCINLENVTLPDNVTSIGYQAFYGCRSLTNLTIPDSVTSIGNNAFYDCNKLKITCHSERVRDLIIKSGFRNKDKIILTK